MAQGNRLTAGLSRKQSNAIYNEVLEQGVRGADVTDALRSLCREDLFFLLTRACRREDIDRDWLFHRCREVEAEPNGRLDLWARDHYKSTIITFGHSIKDVLNKPEITIGLFSHTRPIAKAFLHQIMQELEKNTFLVDLFPDVLWRYPRRESPRWSLDNGIVVKRKTNPKEATIEANGLVDGQPISKHYELLVYDDVVTEDSVYTPDMIKKTTKAWELSLALGSQNRGRKGRRTIGTRYHHGDTYKEMMDRESVIPRIHPATDDGTPSGKPVLLTREILQEKWQDFGPYTFACQMLQNPTADSAQGFKREWLKYYDAHQMHAGQKPWPRTWNYYLLCDPAGEKKKENDYTVMLVIALGSDQNYYLVDGIRDRLNLVERTKKLFHFVRLYDISMTGYEKYGKDSDIEHILDTQEREQFRFPVVALGGPMPKNDRIRKLIAPFSSGRFFLPYERVFLDYTGRSHELIKEFTEDEFLAFPVAQHDDVLDCMARIMDPALGAVFPKAPAILEAERRRGKREYNPLEYR